MANTSFNGPVRSENGFATIAKSSTTGEVTTLVNIGVAAVALADSNVTLTAATNSGPINIIPDGAQANTFTLPTPVAGVSYTFVYGGGAADASNHIITTGADTKYFVGGVTFHDTDDGAVSVVYSDGNSNSKLTLNVLGACMITIMGTSATTYQVYGWVAAATAPAFADQ